MHRNSQLLFQKYARPHFRPGLRVLEVGPDASPSTYQALVNDPSITWDTLDFPSRPFPLTHRLESEYTFPIPDGAYDLVLSGQVIEHVRKVWVWVREVARVVRPGGLVVTINPVSWPYHEAPVDCWRIFPEGMRALYEDAGLEVIESVWDSLEADGNKWTLPGRSPEWQPPKVRWMNRVMGWFGYPREYAYDAVTIGKRADVRKDAG